jgi:hypothetical protein
MRTPDEPAPLRELHVPVELEDLLASDAVWALPPADLLDDVLVAIGAPSVR